MTKAEIERLVSEGFTIDQENKERSKRLDEIKEVLAGASNGDPCEFLGERGPDGNPVCKAAITFSARMDDTLFPDKEQQVKEIAGSFFNKLFCRRPIAKFEDVAKALLGREKGEQLAAFLRGLPGPRVSFKKF